jgi:hypothetical protein
MPMKNSSYYSRISGIILGGIFLRLWFWHSTQLVLEDALITFRYAENIAHGYGFVYNIGEKVLGTTTPLWTIVLAAAKKIGCDIFLSSHILSILFDSLTCLLISSLLYEYNQAVAYLWTFLFAIAPDIIPVSMSGMETSLFLFLISWTLWGAIRKNDVCAIGAILVLLTRIDGFIFIAGIATLTLFEDRRWCFRQTIIAVPLYVLWLIFSWWYFGTLVPQSQLPSLQATITI